MMTMACDVSNGTRIKWRDQDGHQQVGVIQEPPDWPAHYVEGKFRYFKADAGHWFWIRGRATVETLT